MSDGQTTGKSVSLTIFTQAALDVINSQFSGADSGYGECFNSHSVYWYSLFKSL